MESIKQAIDHLCGSIMHGAAGGSGWTAGQIKDLSSGVLLLAQAEAALNPTVVETDPITAASVVWKYCRSIQYCADCKMKQFCQTDAPCVWSNPSEVNT